MILPTGSPSPGHAPVRRYPRARPCCEIAIGRQAATKSPRFGSPETTRYTPMGAALSVFEISTPNASPIAIRNTAAMTIPPMHRPISRAASSCLVLSLQASDPGAFSAVLYGWLIMTRSSRGKGREFVGEKAKNAVPYRSSFILHYERPAFSLHQLRPPIHLSARRQSGGEIPENAHCSFSVDGSLTRPLSFRPGRGAPSSSALICLQSRHIAAVIVSPRSKPASSARLRNASISRFNAAGSLNVIASFSCLRLRTPIGLLLGT